GLSEILERTPAPVVPMALRGLWGSFFSRSANGKAMRRLRGFFSRITLAAGAPIAPRDATPERLKDEVLALRGGQR
ncbi:MAG: glycerol acyltransferase, partial [Burkholderiales bacterium]|nr:glycerol acyltransferase [Burkholderiales bacterium]